MNEKINNPHIFVIITIDIMICDSFITIKKIDTDIYILLFY